MNPYYQDENVTLYHGDCLEVLRGLPDNSVDAIVTDPPYGLSNTKPAQVADVLAAWVTGQTEAVPAKRGGFMGADWDSFVPPPAVWSECLRVLKPGGHMAVFAGARTQDLMGLSIRLAGFEIRDTLGWIYGSGFPKSHDIGKAIDKAAGAEREVVGPRVRLGDKRDYPYNSESAIYGTDNQDGAGVRPPITAPATPEAERWSGWGTALKPAIEPIILARKPLDGTVAANVLAHGVGGLNIDASRVGTEGGGTHCGNRDRDGKCLGHGDAGKSQSGATFHADESNGPSGRFPANVLLDEHAAEEMDRQSGVLKTGGGNRASNSREIYGGYTGQDETRTFASNEGGASRFFPVFKYQAKAPKKERPVIVREDGTKVQHPTVKPVALMSWLVELITPPNGVVLDPFAGTGTTLQAATNKGFQPIGIEQDADYIELIEKRLAQEVLFA